MKQKDKQSKAIVSPNNKPDYTWFFITGIIVLTAVLYSNTLHNEILASDDIEYFTNYPEIRDLSWTNIVKYFSSYYVIMYQPLPILTFAINYKLTGLDTVPLHLLNILMHLVNIWLVYCLIMQLTNKRPLSIIVAIVFALHPMNVEAITWISARSSSMYTLFYLIALLFYIRYLNNNYKAKNIVYAVLFLILSLFSKAQAITFPILLLAIDYFFNRKWSWKILIEKVPFFILSLIFGIIAIMDTGTQKNINNGMQILYNIYDLFFMFCYSFVFYLYRFIVPVDLCGIYTYPMKMNNLLPWYYYISPAICLGAIYLLYRARKNRYIVFGAALFLITISINIQIVPSRLVLVTDRYAYFPYIGLAFIVGYYYQQVFDESMIKAVYIMKSALALWCLFFCITIWQRNQVWQNNLVFITDIIEKNPPVPYLTNAYGNRGDYYLEKGMVQEALSDFDEAIRLKPGDGKTYYNRATGYIKIHDLPRALSDLDSSIRHVPMNPMGYSNRAFVRFNMKDIDGALKDCDSCICQDSNVAKAFTIRSAIDFMHDDYITCEKDINRTLLLDPNQPEVYKNLGLLYIYTNRQKKACEEWNTAIQMGDREASALKIKYCK